MLVLGFVIMCLDTWLSGLPATPVKHYPQGGELTSRSAFHPSYLRFAHSASAVSFASLLSDVLTLAVLFRHSPPLAGDAPLLQGLSNFFAAGGLGLRFFTTIADPIGRSSDHAFLGRFVRAVQASQ
jgi:hypothetical protein